MSPDLVVVAGMAAVGVAAYAVSYTTTRTTLAATTGHPTTSEDLVAIAQAVGVLVNDDGISSGVMAARIAWHTQPRPHVPEVLDHTLCEGDCGNVICCCRPLHGRDRCEGTVEQACGHQTPLCEDCARAFCGDCLVEWLTGFGWYGGAR